jgi:hypothetical protein
MLFKSILEAPRIELEIQFQLLELNYLSLKT